ncbi:MAG: dihydrolipoamide dehydrogenase [Flavobacteriales bacterium]|nr:dihydrolipoamide dehydrogenase [Flavobacteriales bacterium]|tara:strand:+ start:156 stop:992 length:837 start_codon:yes stop_codon:yes gene_type:complete
MKKFKLFMLAALTTVFTVQAQELPVPSPYAEVMQKVGLTDVKVEYSRPGVKERKIFGGLLKWGQVWRTGANASTKITFSTDANVGGEEVKAGTYSVFTQLEEGTFVVMFNSDVNASEGSFNADNNVIEVKAKVLESEMTETFTITFSNLTENTAELTFQWEKSKWSVPIKVEADEMAMKNIEQKIKEIENSYGAYNAAARYYLEHSKDLDQALAWSKKSVEISAQFWNTITLSKIYAAKGDYKNAIKVAEQSKALAEKANYDAYIKMNDENIKAWKKK